MMRTASGPLCLAMLITLLLFATPAHAWWNSTWPNRMKLHLDTTAKGAAISDPIGHAQVLIRLQATNFNFDTANPDGGDLRIIAGDDRTPLHFQIEKYDALIDQVALIWVDVPDLPPNADTALYIYWGNKSASAASDAKATFSAGQVLVYHFAEETGPPRDSTGFANDAVSAAEHGQGLIDGDEKFNGQNMVVLPKSDSLKIAAGQVSTWSMWVKPGAAAATTQNAAIFSQADGTNGFTIGLAQGVPYAEVGGPSGAQRAAGAAPLDPASWHLLVVTASDTTITLYVDGAPAATLSASLPALPSLATLGGAAATPAPDAGSTVSAPPAVTNGYAGELDEFEINKTLVPPGIIKLWMTEKNAEKLFVFDVAEQNSFFGNGYVGVIVRSVTPDAWFVIGLLGLMSLISWWAMINKALFLGRVARANARFEAQYRVASAPGATAGAAASGLSGKYTPQLRRSPLYRLYSVGTRELEQRLRAGQLEPDGRLAPQSIEAMRASVDATLVRESQRLSATMVLLTICISGGPFLGLLGTVVGVMITFAAIAQAGDVNVNAIAPGVAAALLATVAGLAVAIPALFGYNWLLTRIRDINAQMTAFANELVARMAEQVRAPADGGGPT